MTETDVPKQYGENSGLTNWPDDVLKKLAASLEQIPYSFIRDPIRGRLPQTIQKE
jgi:hypothetical protein